MTTLAANDDSRRLCGALAFALILAGLCLAVSGCSQSQDNNVVMRGETMGTTWLVRARPVADAQALDRTIQQRLDAVNMSMSTYIPESEISRFNRAGAGCVEISQDFSAVVRASLDLYEITDGAFDVTVAPLVNLWGFGPQERTPEPPTAEALAAVKKSMGSDKLSFEGEKLCKSQQDITIDLSAIAKGYAVDEVTKIVQAAGGTDYLVEIGGELKVLGERPSSEPWQVAVERPDPEKRTVYGVLPVNDDAIATSGEYRNFYVIEGQRYSHTLDPRTGWPITHQPGSVTVVHSSAMQADGLATALNVMGYETGQVWAEEQGLSVLYLLQDEETFKEYPTTAFSSRFGQIH